MNAEMTVLPKESRTGAGLAGIGSGTGIIALAQALPEENSFKPWLIYAAPTLSIAASAMWLLAQVEIANFVQEWRIKAFAKKVRSYLREAIKDTSSTGEHQQTLRQKLQEIDLIIAERDLKRLKSMTPILAEDVTTFSKAKGG